MKRHIKALSTAIGLITLFYLIGWIVTHVDKEWILIAVGIFLFYFVFYIAYGDEEKKEKELYSKIEALIIWWKNDGGETTGILTRQIMDAIKQYEKDK